MLLRPTFTSSYDTNNNNHAPNDSQAIAKGGVACPFPWRLHDMLDAVVEEGLEHIVSWQPHGRAFMVHDITAFVDKVLSRFFSQTKYPSFQRQLNLYGFSRFAHGKDKGAYFHQCFVRGDRPLVRGMVRRKIKGTKVRRAISPHEEPDFYAEAYTMATDKLKIPPVYSSSKASTEDSETPSVVSSGEEQSFTSDLDTVSLDDDDFILFDPLTLFRSESLANDIALGAIAI